MSESLESITLDEYLNAQQHKDAISAGISSVWGDSWDDDLELKERVLPAHLMETRDGLLWLAKNVVEQARFTEDLVNLLGKARSDALDLAFGTFPEEDEEPFVELTLARSQLAQLYVRMLFLTHHLGSTLFCVVVQKLAEIAKQSLAMGNPDLWEMVVSEMWVDLQWTLEGMLSDLETALSQRTGQNCQGAFWRRLDLSVDDTMSEDELDSDEEDVEED